MKLLQPGLYHALLLLFFCSVGIIFAQTPQPTASLESIINQYVLPYGISPSNRFKLAAYTELKGRFNHDAKAVVLDFGRLGYLSFYERSCLLRLPNNRIYSLKRYETGTDQVAEMDRQLDHLFERIIMLSDGNASKDHIAFVDKHLSKKNLEPFEKIFVRHILVHYGTFNPMLQEVVFESEVLPTRSHEKTRREGELVRQTSTPLRMRLDAATLRGWYLNSGGTVFIHEVDRNVRFATGEVYDHNVAAFKVFGQKLFVQSVQFIAQAEADRLTRLQAEGATMDRMVTIDSPIEDSHAFASNEERNLVRYEQRWRENHAMGVQPLYTQFSWIPMMLSMLRNERVNIGDADVICYFVHLEVFEKIYQQLLREEKLKVDFYLSKEGLPSPEKEFVIAE